MRSTRTATAAHVTGAIDEMALAQHIGRGADLPALLMTVAHLTGDLSILRPAWTPVNILGTARCDVSPQEEADIKQECLRRLIGYLNAGAEPLSRPDAAFIDAIAEWFMGSAGAPYAPVLAEELVIGDEDLRRPSWSKAEVAPDRPLHVMIVGAGESGLIAGIRLKQAGIPFTIYEKNDDVGGTWLENHYPGCRVDINSFTYSYASEQKIWSEYYSTQPDVCSYFRGVAEKHGIYEHIRFGIEITGASWNGNDGGWELVAHSLQGEERVKGDILIFAVGQLNRPKLPDLPGRDEFGGAAFHSANWDQSIDLQGKRVGVIGTGASGCQIIPKVADMAAKVSIFLRTVPWLLPTPDLHESVSDSTRWLMGNLPGYLQWYRASIFFYGAHGFLEQVIVDDNYPASERAVSAANDEARQQLQQWLETQIADRPDLRDAVIPTAPVGAKRILRDNGTWIRTLKRENVEIVRAPIDRITQAGIQDSDGRTYEFDVLLYGTGFQASKFLFPIEVRGTGGMRLSDYWKQGAGAYLGMTVPHFPNMFCMYGPNTNVVVHGASVILFSELTTKYIMDAIHGLLKTGKKSLEVREDIYRVYNERVDAANRKRAWGFSKVNSWYKDDSGRVTQNYPFSLPEFYKKTNKVEPDDFIFDD